MSSGQKENSDQLSVERRNGGRLQACFIMMQGMVSGNIFPAVALSGKKDMY
jgi:hypothetical protein